MLTEGQAIGYLLKSRITDVNEVVDTASQRGRTSQCQARTLLNGGGDQTKNRSRP